MMKKVSFFVDENDEELLSVLNALGRKKSVFLKAAIEYYLENKPQELFNYKKLDKNNPDDLLFHVMKNQIIDAPKKVKEKPIKEEKINKYDETSKKEEIKKPIERKRKSIVLPKNEESISITEDSSPTEKTEPTEQDTLALKGLEMFGL